MGWSVSWLDLYTDIALSCLRVDNGINILDGIFDNPWFLGIQALTFLGQILIVFKGGNVFGTQPLNGAQWGWSVLFGLLVVPVGAAIRCVPDRWMLAVVHRVEPVANHVTRIIRRAFRGRGDHVREQRRSADIEAATDRNSRRAQRPWHKRLLRRLSKGKNNQDLETSTDVILGTIEGRRVGTPENQEPFDVYSAIEASKNGFAEGAVDGLNVHPGTASHDPVITPSAQLLKAGQHPVPPSQDWEIMRFIGVFR